MVFQNHVKTNDSNGSNYIVSKNKKRIEITYKGGICSNGKKKEKKKSRIIVKIIRDSYGNVTRVFVEPKAKKKKEVVDMAAAAYQSLLAME